MSDSNGTGTHIEQNPPSSASGSGDGRSHPRHAGVEERERHYREHDAIERAGTGAGARLPVDRRPPAGRPAGGEPPPGEDFDRLFLQGSRSRWRELLRLARIGLEFIRGERRLHFAGPCVTVFGSARTDEGHPDYDRARELGRQLARAGFTVMTGGGPGIMEAANRGARDAGGRSVGSNIKLVDFETPNPYLDTWVPFHYFFVRKVMLVRYSYAFVFLPGGFGTLDEIFETATLVQTRKIRDFPMILMGSEYWRPLLAFLQQLVADGKIDQADLDRFVVTDSPEEAATLCRDAAIRRFGLSYTRPIRRRWWLAE